MIEFVARINGKTVLYPKDAKFIVEQRRGHRSFDRPKECSNIHKALTVANGIVDSGRRAKISTLYKGHVQELIRL